MAVHGDALNNDAVKTVEAPGIQEPQLAPGARILGGVFALNDLFNSNQSLGKPVEEYLSSVKGYFNNNTNVSLVNIEVRRLTTPNGAHAFIANKRAIIMLFTETLAAAELRDFTPTSELVGVAYKTLTDTVGQDIKLVNSLIIQPADYGRAQQAAQHITSSLAIATRPELYSASIAQLQDAQYTIDPDVNAVRQYIEGMNPSAVRPRVDIGFVLYARQPKKQQYQTPGVYDNAVAIAAVGGYTDFVKGTDPRDGSTHRLQPIVHISSIVSSMPVPGIIPLVLPIAASQFISSGRWLAPFSTFQKGRPNLGQFIPDPKDNNKLWFINNHQDLDTFRQQKLLHPVLVLDVTEGTSRISALGNYASIEKKEAVYDQIQNFFGARLTLDRSANPFTVVNSFYQGVYGDAAGSLLDSRTIDYVGLLANGAQDKAAELLLEYHYDPVHRARVIAEKTGGSFKSLYRTTISLLNPVLLATLAQAIKSQLPIEGPQDQSSAIPTDWLGQQAAVYGTQGFGVYREGNRFATAGVNYFG